MTIKVESRGPGLVPGRSGAREAGDSSRNYQSQTWNRRQRPQLTSTGRGAPRGCWAAAPRRGPGGQRTPQLSQQPAFPNQLSPEQKRPCQAPQTVGKTRLWTKQGHSAAPEHCFPALGHGDPTTHAESAVKRGRKTRLWEEEGVKSRASCCSRSFHFTATTCCRRASCWLGQGCPKEA